MRVVVGSAADEETVVEQRFLDLALVVAGRFVAPLPAGKRAQRQVIDTDVPIFEDAVEDVLPGSDILVRHHESRQLHARPLRNRNAIATKRHAPEEKSQFSGLGPVFWPVPAGLGSGLRACSRCAAKPAVRPKTTA